MNMEQKPDQNDAYSEMEEKSVLVRMAKTATGAQAASRITVPWRSSTVSWRSEQPDLIVKLAMHSSGCTEDLQKSLLACSTQQDIILMTDLEGGSSWSNKHSIL